MISKTVGNSALFFDSSFDTEKICSFMDKYI